MITLTPEFETKVRRLFGETDDTLPVRFEVEVSPRNAAYGCNLCSKHGHEDLYYVWVGGTQRLFFGEEHFLDEVDPTLGYRGESVIAARETILRLLSKGAYFSAAHLVLDPKTNLDTADDLPVLAQNLLDAVSALAARGNEYKAGGIESA